MRKMRFNTDRIVGLSAMVISVLTLLIFIYQTGLMREQSRLSVTPRISFNEIRSTVDSITTISGEIINKGLGPAIIESIHIVHKNKKYELDFDDFLDEVYPDIEKYGSLTNNTTMSKGSTLAPNERNTLYTYVIKRSNLEALLQYMEIGEEDIPIVIEVVYSSIYQEKWQTRNDSKGHPIEL